MPLSPDFQKIRKGLTDKYGKEKGTENYYKWLNKNGFDDTKPMSGQKSKANATGDIYDPILSLFDDIPDDTMPTEDPDTLSARQVPVSDSMDRLQAKEDVALKERKDEQPTPYQKGVKDPEDSIGGGYEKPDAVKDKIPQQASKFISVPMYKFIYTAAPRPGFEGKDGPILIKSLVLEEGVNVNGWKVDPREFQNVADQYKAGRHLRINHSKNMEDVIGKSYDGKVIKGVDVPGYLGLENSPDGINPNGQYVAAEFEANPQDQQVRTNILRGYVETGSIGLDANAFCAECNKPVKSNPDGEMERTCRHMESDINLRDVDVKEYSYVAEPAFEHTKAYPSFSAAVSSLFAKGSSLSPSQTQVNSEMSATVPVEVTKQAKVEASAAAKKADAEGDGDAEGEADAMAAKYISYYKKGVADAAKFRADGDSDSDSKKSDADASAADNKKGDADASLTASSAKKVTTDQVGVTTQTKQYQAKEKGDLMEAVMHPTAYQLRDPMIREIFKAAVEHPNAPASVRRFKGARWE